MCDHGNISYPRRHVSSVAVLLLIGVIAAAAILMGQGPAAAQAGKIEKPDITFGVFPITNYGVVVPFDSAGLLQGRRSQRHPARDGRQPCRGHRRRRLRHRRRDLDGISGRHQPRHSARSIERSRPRRERPGAVHGQERFADQGYGRTSSARRSPSSPSAARAT